MTKYLMFPHSGSGNHGCEALARTITYLLNSDNTILFSDNAKEDRCYSVDKIVSICDSKHIIRKFSADYFTAAFRKYILNQKDAFDAVTFRNVISNCNENSFLLSIGGDNYCYGENEYIYLVNRYAKKKKSKTVLFGCSVEPDEISAQMRTDLESYDLIVARESITYNALKKINKNIVLYPDPAFSLKQEPGDFPLGLGKNPYIGINISPMIQDKETIDGITIKNYENLIQYILQKTECDIALIPHVVWKNNDDRIPLKKLYEKFKDTNRVYMVEDQNCMKLKNIISKCEFFIGARTHATIAAYSTCVPTLVVGYSVKAKGIARDLFNSEESYVIPVQSLKNDNDLVLCFDNLYSEKENIKKHLRDIMPEYIEQVYSVKNELLKLQQ